MIVKGALEKAKLYIEFIQEIQINTILLLIRSRALVSPSQEKQAPGPIRYVKLL